MISGRRNLARGALGAALILIFLAPAVEPGLAQTLPTWNRERKKLLRQYEKKPKHKAFAVSNAASSSMVQSCGAAWSAPSKASAEQRAISTCRQGFGSGCVIKTSE